MTELAPDPELQPTGDETTTLHAFLDYQRTILIRKAEGIADEQARRTIEPSDLSLLGLIRHMAEVERNWFHRVLLEEPETPPIWYDPAIDDSELVPLDDADWDADLARWREECDASRSAAAGFDLDHTGLRRGKPCSLRWIYVHMIEEYARHNGHADLIREQVDGTVGY